MWDQLRNLNNSHQELLNNNLGQLSSELSRIADGMRANYVRIGEERKVDSACWLAARTLQYHVTTNSEYTSRDDALRHVFKLIHAVNKTIDSDSDVVRLKEKIENSVAASLGEEKKEELHKEKVYLSKPEDVDF
jgi:methionyl-tRNA synthetase